MWRLSRSRGSAAGKIAVAPRHGVWRSVDKPAKRVRGFRAFRAHLAQLAEAAGFYQPSPLGATGATVPARSFEKNWGETGGTPRDKDEEIRVRTGKLRFQPQREHCSAKRRVSCDVR